jgi:hypothetical protein
MGCDFYIITGLDIDFTHDNEKNYIQLNRDCGYIWGDKSVDECIGRYCSRDIIYEDGKWLIHDEDMIELYHYVLEKNDVNLYNVVRITKVKTGEKRY